VAVGVFAGGEEFYACHGVTSVAGATIPVPVDEQTLFHLGSISKTYTATALVRLAEQGRVDLDAPVRAYVPELRLADERNAAEITVRNLLNHTAGLEWNLIDPDEGDGSLAAFVAKMEGLGVIAAPGKRASYSQAGFNLAGRVVEKVTGLPFERAVAELALQPAGLMDTVYDMDQVILRRHAIGHNRDTEGEVRPASPWRGYPAGAHGNNPGGGIAATASDLLRWAGSTSAMSRHCCACRSPRSSSAAAASGTRSGCAGSSRTSPVSAPSATAVRATASSRRS
jgi:CubicO group peptidase (beta-lactamase class C family)